MVAAGLVLASVVASFWLLVWGAGPASLAGAALVAAVMAMGWFRPRGWLVTAGVLVAGACAITAAAVLSLTPARQVAAPLVVLVLQVAALRWLGWRRVVDSYRNLAQWQRGPIALFAAISLIAALWFFLARDDRGATSRLTADAWYYHAYLPSLVLDRDLDFRDEYQITHNWYRFGQTPLGRPANVFGIGPAVFEMPFFLVGHGITRATGGTADGFSTAEVKLALLASLLASLGAIFFAWRVIARRFGGHLSPLLIAVAAAGATPLVYYAIRQPGYAHPFAALWIAWFIDLWDRSFDGSDQPRSLRCWLALGATLGCAALARPQTGLWGIILILCAADDLRRSRDARERVRVASRWLCGGAVCVAALLPQLLSWKALYGAFYTVPQGDGFMRWDAVAWSEVIFSSRNGLLPWTPIVTLCLIGLVSAVRSRARLVIPLLVGFVAQVHVNGAVWDWWAGGSFGARRFDSCYIAFAVGLAALLHVDLGPSTARRRATIALRATLGVLVALLVLGNLGLARKTSAPTARIYGGQAAHRVLRAQIPGASGVVIAALSKLGNAPARILFAWRHDTSTALYDQLVGVHLLGELYPGLNSIRDKKREVLDLAGGRSPRLRGFEPAPDGRGAALRGDTGRILLGFNRRDPIRLRLHLRHAEGHPSNPSSPGSASIPSITSSTLGAPGQEGRRIARTGNREVWELALPISPRGVMELAITGYPGLILERLECAVDQGR